MKQAEELIQEIQKGLLKWYDFRQNGRVLFTGETKSALVEMLEEKGMQVLCASCGQICDSAWQQEQKGKFDYIVSVETLELEPDPERFLRIFKQLLKEEGKLLLGMNNRLGIRYFCGDKDPYTERNFDGVEGYKRAYSQKMDVFKGRCYSQAELKEMLQNAGWEFCYFYTVLPDLQNPCLICGQEWLPNEDLVNRFYPSYHDPTTVFLEEENMYGSLVKNGMFHNMANAYLIECSLNDTFCDACYITSSMERGKEHALFTVIHKSGTVEKRAAYTEGRDGLEKTVEHMNDLSDRGICTVKAVIKNGACIMPYINCETGQIYLKRLLKNNLEKFLEEMDRFRELILQSSEIVKPDQGDGEGAILRRAYLDMVPLNSFYTGNTFMFFDQEFCKENYPANVVITRMVDSFYSRDLEIHGILKPEVLLERYGLMEKLEKWRRMGGTFLAELRKERELRNYHEMYRCSSEVIHSNRQRMNYSQEEYERRFVDIFRDLDTKKLILFGSGNYTKRFLTLYRSDYPVYGIVDNNQAVWGKEIEGIVIQSPRMLEELSQGEYKVLICIKNYMSVMKQLDNMGINQYGIFDGNRSYPRKQRAAVRIQDGEEEKKGHKKYHRGYIAGVFDLFHIGHLNMFKRAKEQCDYLIVGVVSDEGVRKNKGVEPFVPFEERLEMVRSCRYVDEAVEIPFGFSGTKDAYRLYQFDCQFSGSDYTDNPDWLANKTFLQKHGSDLVFFPYTESTSSTKLKALIEKKIL